MAINNNQGNYRSMKVGNPTPTILRSTMQGYEPDRYPNHTQFIPPVFHSNYQLLHKSGSNTQVLDPNVSSEANTSYHKSLSDACLNSVPQKKRNIGGRKKTIKHLSAEEEEKQAIRRERNKLAAARCRKRRLDHTNHLTLQAEDLQNRRNRLQQEIYQLEEKKADLLKFFDIHSQCEDIKSELCSGYTPGPSNKGIEKSSLSVATGSIEKNLRPTCLPVDAYLPLPTGVPTLAPSVSNTFNFDSLMEGGTGLTPISAPRVSTTVIPLQNSECGITILSQDCKKLVCL